MSQSKNFRNLTGIPVPGRDSNPRIGNWPGSRCRVALPTPVFECAKFNLGESIWDRYIHNKVDEEKVFETGDDACLSYNYPERDVKMLSDLGVSQYRFTFSWPRIVPTGRIQDGVNQAGIRYYSTLINLLIQEKALKILI